MWYEAQPPTMTGTGSSAMNRFRLSGSATDDTCSAETTVPWMTRMSRPASSADVHVVGHPLRGERARRDHALVLDLLDPVGDQLGLDRLPVHLLQAARGLAGGIAAMRSSSASASS